MSKLLSSNAGDNTEKHVAKIKTVLERGDVPVIAAGLEDLMGDKPNPNVIANFQTNELEGFERGVTSHIDPIITQISEGITSELAAGNNGDTGLSPAEKVAQASHLRASKQAARILAMTAKDEQSFRQYHQFSSAPVAGGDGIEAFDAGLNAFDPTSYRDVVSRSIAYTPASLVQSTTAELLFTTIACTPDQANYQFRTLVPTLTRHKQRDKDGNPYEINPRRLIDATRYQDILVHDLIDIVPLYKPSRSAFFVDVADVLPWNVERDGTTFQTSAIRMNVKADLISLNSLEENPARGNSSERDMLDKGLGIKAFLVRVTNDDGDSTVFIVDATHKTTTHFHKGQVADTANELIAIFDEVIHINAKTPVLGGGAPEALATLLGINPDVSVGVHFQAAGKADTENANVSVSRVGDGASLTGEVWERSVNGTRRTHITDAPTLAAVEDAFTTIEVLGWIPKAKLRNTSLRDIGQLVRVQEQFKAYPIEMQSPFTAQVPPGEESNVNKAELRKLAFTAAKIDNDMAAHRMIWEHVDNMRAYKGLNKDIGNHVWDRLGYVSDPYIDPQFDEFTVDLLRDTQNNSSGGKFVDITSVLSLNITDLAMVLIRESNINAALEMLGASNYKVSIVAITDPYVAAYIRTIGDARTAGVEHKVLVASTVDELFRDKILITLRVDLDGDAGILNTGFHLAVPRYVTDVTFPRDGGVANEVTIQNRRQYVVTTPIFGVINVKNLTQAVRNNVPFKVNI